jgi:hypothetical protein
MATIETSTRGARWGLALLAGMAGLLTGMPAQAQVCGASDSMREELLDLYLDELDDEFEVDTGDEEFCSKLTENFVKACRTLIKDTVKCVKNQISSLGKQNKESCKEFAPGDSDCTGFYKDLTKEGLAGVSGVGDEEAELCELDSAEEFFDVCMFGFP